MADEVGEEARLDRALVLHAVHVTHWRPASPTARLLSRPANRSPAGSRRRPQHGRRRRHLSTRRRVSRPQTTAVAVAVGDRGRTPRRLAPGTGSRSSSPGSSAVVTPGRELVGRDRPAVRAQLGRKRERAHRHRLGRSGRRASGRRASRRVAVWPTRRGRRAGAGKPRGARVLAGHRADDEGAVSTRIPSSPSSERSASATARKPEVQHRTRLCPPASGRVLAPTQQSKRLSSVDGRGTRTARAHCTSPRGGGVSVSVWASAGGRSASATAFATAAGALPADSPQPWSPGVNGDGVWFRHSIRGAWRPSARGSPRTSRSGTGRPHPSGTLGEGAAEPVQTAP